jgi:hypothetical protein
MRLAALTAILTLGACAESTPLESVRWTVEDTPAGASMTAFDPAPVLRITCVDASGQMRIEAFTFTPVASNEELAFGTADESYLFVARAAEGGPGVVATGPIPIPLLTSFISAGAVSAVYGPQQIGPLVLPARDADAFAGQCLGQFGSPWPRSASPEY